LTRERQILDAAAALFYEKGFHGVGVDEIGERVGISGPALYRHFKGKDEILAALFNEALEELISATAAVYAEPHRDLERLIRHHVEFAIDHRHLVNVYQREERSLVEPWKGHFQRRERHYAARWEKALSMCFPDAPPEDIAAGAQAAVGLIHSVAHWPRESRKSPDLPDLLYRMVTYGLASLQLPRDAELTLAPDKVGVKADERDVPSPREARKTADRPRRRSSRTRAA
jgi:AcrR family transcriptional regulator